jgi:hypothetical protein
LNEWYVFPSCFFGTPGLTTPPGRRTGNIKNTVLALKIVRYGQFKKVSAVLQHFIRVEKKNIQIGQVFDKFCSGGANHAAAYPDESKNTKEIHTIWSEKKKGKIIIKN